MTATANAIELPPFEPDPGTPLTPPPEPPPEPEQRQLPPRSRRRKTKPEEPTPKVEDVPPQAISEEDKQALAGLLTTGFGVLFEIVASRRGEHWRLTRPEAERLGMAWGEPLAPLLARHSQYVPWAVALLATSGVLMPRLAVDADKLANAEEGNAKTA